ncbi:hypothetical protein L6164_014946 [Bauhinia variegata]|uniref:Uncharacterized protein n=1 Tax=Bauhinia variegata TaxID=167791 RepID=A0ACB9NIZ2_BAUVA|nr:hypothetical protein L6164_014946 [Bauhinia variegata]
MALPAHFDDEFDFEGRLDGKHFSIGYKRSTPAYDDEDYDGDPFTSKKARSLLVDPSIHEEFTGLKMNELVKKVALQESQNTELRN